MTGTVKTFDAKKGFGFIIPDEGARDVFVHHTNIVAKGFKTLDKDERVEFEVQETPRGKNALNVIVIGNAVQHER